MLHSEPRFKFCVCGPLTRDRRSLIKNWNNNQTHSFHVTNKKKDENSLSHCRNPQRYFYFASCWNVWQVGKKFHSFAMKILRYNRCFVWCSIIVMKHDITNGRSFLFLEAQLIVQNVDNSFTRNAHFSRNCGFLSYYLLNSFRPFGLTQPIFPESSTLAIFLTSLLCENVQNHSCLWFFFPRLWI